MKIRLSYILTCVLILAMGCTSDFFNIEKESVDTGISIFLPSSGLKFATRASDDGNREIPEEKEGVINTLAVFAYPTGNEGESFSIVLEKNDETSDGKFDVPLKPGNYRIYMIANLEIEGTVSEPDLKGMLLSLESKHFNADGTIPTQGIPMTAAPGQYRKSADGDYYESGIEIRSGELTPIFCNLHFALAKVRLTIHRSHAPSAAVGDILIADQSATEPLFSSFYSDFCYRGIESHKLSNGEYTEGSENGENWVYQAVYYFPEKIVENSEDMTRLSIPIMNSTGTEKTVDFRLGSNGGDNSGESGNSLPVSPRQLFRGHLYDYTLNDSGDWSLKVSDWNQKTLLYNLTDKVYLDLERTSIEMRSSEITLIGYETNARNLSFESPLFDNGSNPKAMCNAPGDKTVDLLLFSTVEKDGKRYIAVRVNPLVQKYALQMADIEDFPFTVIADGIRKKITITSLLGERFLRVFPEEIELDIEQLRADGIDQISFPITWESNLINSSNYNCEIAKYFNWESSNMEISGSSTFTSATKASGNNTLTFNHLSNEYWNTGKTIILNYTSRFGTPTERIEALKEVKIIVIPPKNSTYTIYFKPPKSWDLALRKNNPNLNIESHIFIYQELTLPEKMNEPSRQGKTVAISNSLSDKSAYQYVFSGKIAFKGWNGFEANSPEINDPLASGYLSNNFFVFDNYSFDISDGINERYDFNHEFNETLRSNNICNKCKSNSNQHSILEPGICMEKFDGSWWKYELTGIAEPKKTYIRFYAHHDYDYICYPSKGSPAIKLFNFEDREGWFDLEANMTTFSDNKPDNSPGLGTNFISPILWSTNSNWRYIKIIECKNIYYLKGGEIYPPAGIAKNNIEMHYYFDFTPSKLNDFSIKFKLISDKSEQSTSTTHTITQKSALINYTIGI